MNYKEEIKKLQARVDELERKSGGVEKPQHKKITLEEFLQGRNPVAINCDTKEKLEELSKGFKELGLNDFGETLLRSTWIDEKRTCCVKCLKFATKEECEGVEIPVFEFDEVILQSEPKPQHEFKVGDRVQFKSWKELEKEFGKAKYEFGIRFIELPSGSNFIEDKKYLGGTYATITKIRGNGQVFLKDFSRKSSDNLLWQYSLDMLKPAKSVLRWSFTEDEKTILRNVDEEYKWLARDENNSLYAYENKPTKNLLWTNWEDNFVNMGYWEFGNFEELFQCIKWSDKEPCEFRKFL